jgi:hypothetical protein
MATVAVLLLLLTAVEGYSNIGFKSRYASSLKVSTLPSNEGKPTVLSRLTKASRFFLQDQTRSRYAAAMVTYKYMYVCLYVNNVMYRL